MQSGEYIKKGGGTAIHSQPFWCNVDWLSVTVKFHGGIDWLTVAEPSGHRLRVMTGTKVWNTRVLLCLDCGDKVATILCNPKNTKMFDADVGLIEVANEWLYCGGGWEQIFAVIRSVARFEVVSVSRGDLCCDFNPSQYQRDTILQLYRKDCYVQGKGNGCDFWSTNNYKAVADKLADWCKGFPLAHQQSWGHKTSEVKWKLYYKSRELLEKEDKPWIRDRWRQAGLDERDVWRLEVSIHYPHRLMMNDAPITYTRFSHDWWSIFRGLYQTRFVVRRNEGHGDKTNDTVVDFLPWMNQVAADVKCIPSSSSDQRNGRISLLRKLVKALDDDTVLLNETVREGTLWLIDTIVAEDRLGGYFERMMDVSIADWIEQRRVDAYERESAPASGVI